MDIENAQKEFNKYLDKCDIESPKMKRKVGHSYRVMENARDISISLNLSQEEIQVAELIGLLHDIAKFKNPSYEGIFIRETDLDHGDYAVQILQKNNYIRKYIEEDKYDNIIFKAIKNHSKFDIEEGLEEKELLFAKILRDVDKLDIFYEGAEMFWTTEQEIKEKEESKITPGILERFKRNVTIDRKELVTSLDEIVSFIAFIFGINFKYTLQAIKKFDYINIILDKFKCKDEITAKQMEEVRRIANGYLDK